MPQELHVLRCFSCEAFQVQIVKKVPKWQCKICNEKQSVKKVYAKGSGKQCRQYVQELNLKRGELASAEQHAEDLEYKEEYYVPDTVPDTSNISQNKCGGINLEAGSKWSHYIDPPSVQDDDNFAEYSHLNLSSVGTGSKWCQYIDADNNGEESEQDSHFKTVALTSGRKRKRTEVIETNDWSQGTASSEDQMLPFDEHSVVTGEGNNSDQVCDEKYAQENANKTFPPFIDSLEMKCQDNRIFGNDVVPRAQHVNETRKGKNKPCSDRKWAMYYDSSDDENSEDTNYELKANDDNRGINFSNENIPFNYKASDWGKREKKAFGKAESSTESSSNVAVKELSGVFHDTKNLGCVNKLIVPSPFVCSKDEDLDEILNF